MESSLAIVAIFWISAFLIVYTYVLYPLLMRQLAESFSKPVQVAAVTPTVDLIIAAYNEEKTIRDKLINSLALTYPRDKVRITVVADGSNDGTSEIVRSYAAQGIQLLYEAERRGKTAALAHAVSETQGDILLFSDANTFYSADTVQNMVRNFNDPGVGGVSGKKIVLADDTREASSGETAYWRYEAALKTWESQLGSISTSEGEIFAMRRFLFGQIPSGVVHDDMYLTVSIVEKGYRVLYETQATSAEHASRTLVDEFHLKVRYASAGYQILGHFRHLFLPPRSWFALEFISHKVIRWLTPFFLIAVLLSSALLGHTFYRGFFAAQVIFYAMALIGWVLNKMQIQSRVLYFPLYFSLMNIAFFCGAVRHWSGGQTTLWRKATR